MSNFTSEYADTIESCLDPEAAIRVWLDRDNQGRSKSDVQAATKVGEDRLAIVLKGMEAGPVKFQGRFTVRWQRIGDRIRWEAVEGNLVIDGEARFEASATGCRVHWKERIALDMGLNRVVSAFVRPVAERLMTRGQAEFSSRFRGFLNPT